MTVALYSTGPAVALVGIPSGYVPGFYTVISASLTTPVDFTYIEVDDEFILAVNGGQLESASWTCSAIADYVATIEMDAGGKFSINPSSAVNGEGTAINQRTGESFAFSLTVLFTPPVEASITPFPLGTFEQKPKLIVEASYATLTTDEGGGAGIPTDRVYIGKEATVSGIINRLDMQLMLNIMNPPVALGSSINGTSFNSLGFDPSAMNGRDNINTVGTIMGRENKTFDLWIIFPRNLSQPGLIPGYHFLAAFLSGPTEIHPGSGDYKQLIMFQCQRKRVVGQNIRVDSYYRVVSAETDADGDSEAIDSFQVGDQLEVNGGDGEAAVLEIASLLDNGDVGTVTVLSAGEYIVPPTNPVSVTALTRPVPDSVLELLSFTLTFESVDESVSIPNQNADLVLYDHLGVGGAPMNSLSYVFE